MFDNTDGALERLSSGVFLTSGSKSPNVMTIGWGGIGVMWRKKVFIAPVRGSRYTKQLLDESREFGVSIPFEGTYKAELALCGSKSGRDVDKVATLRAHAASKIKTLLVDDCETYFECKVLACIPIDDSMLDDSVKAFYKDHDYHYLYFGEILN